MDIIGLLPGVGQEKKSVLVVCDYATHYQEAVALHSITPTSFWSYLSMYGVPEEILTDKGSNFTL